MWLIVAGGFNSHSWDANPHRGTTPKAWKVSEASRVAPVCRSWNRILLHIRTLFGDFCSGNSNAGFLWKFYSI